MKKIIDIAPKFTLLLRKFTVFNIEKQLEHEDIIPYSTYPTPNNTPKNSSPQDTRSTYFLNLVFN